MKQVNIPQNMCDNTGVMKVLNNMPQLKSRQGGYMIMELLMGLIVLSFVVRPVVVEREDDWGDRTTKVEWELPMVQLLAKIGDFQQLIDRSWAGLDRQFGYKGAAMGESAGKLMRKSLQNGVVLMTAGFVDQGGRFSGDFNNNAERFESAAKGMCVAYSDAAKQGMRN